MKASIIMAAHNAADFIQAAIASALAQTERDFELIVVDDGSTDHTANVVRATAAEDGRVQLLQHKAARGPAAARNTALDRARGDWIAILDSDDAFAPDRLERMIFEAERRDLDILADNLRLIEFETRRVEGPAFPQAWMANPDPIDLAWLLNRDWPGQIRPLSFGFSKPIIRRAFLEGRGLRYAEDIRSGEDLLLYGECLGAGARFGVMPDALYIYSIRRNSVSRSKGAGPHLVRVNDRLSAMPTVATDLALAQIFRKRAIALRYEVFSGSWKSGQLTDAIRAAREMPLGYLFHRIGVSARRRLKGA
jgi:glycosyltransferase involved in cell wall biosynthesis